MKTLNRFLWFFLLAFLLGISGSALGSDVGTATAASKDTVLTQQLQQDFSNHLDFRIGFPSGTCCTSAPSTSGRPPARDAPAWKSTASTARANLLSGQKVLDALKQATATAKKGKEGVGSADAYVRAPLSSAIPIHISI